LRSTQVLGLISDTIIFSLAFDLSAAQADVINKLVAESPTLRHLVKYRLYMRPIEDYKIRQQICDIVGLSSITPILMEIKGAAS
jgi:hypothetical protein